MGTLGLGSMALENRHPPRPARPTHWAAGRAAARAGASLARGFYSPAEAWAGQARRTVALAAPRPPWTPGAGGHARMLPSAIGRGPARAPLAVQVAALLRTALLGCTLVAVRSGLVLPCRERSCVSADAREELKEHARAARRAPERGPPRARCQHCAAAGVAPQ
ncbi:MAG: hypothetical protein J3K34DRAFT_424507 [Monoraphidium minutum]|nr:MAG: hypothetical protein J3K34DRAFT_424507 [Monoraphidium minutum]